MYVCEVVQFCVCKASPGSGAQLPLVCLVAPQTGTLAILHLRGVCTCVLPQYTRVVRGLGDLTILYVKPIPC